MTTRSDSLGNFSFAGLSDGVYQLRARRIGFEESEIKVQISGATDQHVLLSMAANAQALGEVVIAGKRVMFPARYRDAYERMAIGAGDYFTRGKIDSLHPLDMQSLLQTIPGISVNGNKLHLERCDDALNPFVTTANRNNVAKVQVYVDGVRVTDYTDDLHSAQSARNLPGVVLQTSSNLDNPRDASHELRDIVPSSLQLVEVYRGIANIPGEYVSDACAVILLWTK